MPPTHQGSHILPCIGPINTPIVTLHLLPFPPGPVSVPLLCHNNGAQSREPHTFFYLFLCLLSHLLPGLSQDPGLAAPGGQGMSLLLLQGLQLWGQLGGEGV